MEKNYEKPTIMNLKEIEILNKCLEFKSDILDFLVAEARHCEHPSDIYKALVAVDKDVKEADTPSCILIAKRFIYHSLRLETKASTSHRTSLVVSRLLMYKTNFSCM